MLVETSSTLDCFDLARTTKKFQTKVYGIKICFQNSTTKKNNNNISYYRRYGN